MTTNKDLKIQYKSETGEAHIVINYELYSVSNDYVEWLENKLIESLKTIENIIGNEKLNIP